MNTKPIQHLYIHIPFCHRRCSYCDFNTYANMEHRMEAYVAALCTELQLLAKQHRPAPHLFEQPTASALLTRAALQPTIFLGGGTPSMLPLPLMERVLEAANALVPLAGAEVTVEANPGTVLGGAYLRGLRALGVNRLSMGVQSLHDPTLKVLGRIHTAAEARASFEDARRAGFDNINIDFIFGLPGQSEAHWRESLGILAGWGADHLSLYSLIVEQGTPLEAQVAAGRVQVPDDDAAGAMYEAAIEHLAEAGYIQYEVSNWARRECSVLSAQCSVEPAAATECSVLSAQCSVEQAAIAAGNLKLKTQNLKLPAGACQHNLAYWLNADYLAAGAGAHGHLFPQRYANIRGIEPYIRSLRNGQLPVAETTDLAADDLRAETMFMGLRLNVGVSFAHFLDRCGVSLDEAYGATIAELEALGLMERDERAVRLTDRGRLLGNQVFVRFV